MNQRRTYRGALLGLGGIAREGHLPAFLGDPVLRERIRIIAAVDTGPGVTPGTAPALVPLPALAPAPTPEPEPAAVPPHPAIQCFTSREELAEVADLDFVDICTPTGTHLELALWALERGYHVICEKPVALSAGEARLLLEAGRRAGRVLVPCHQYHFNPAWRQLAAWLRAGLIGEWHLAEIAIHRPHADPGIRQGGLPWRGRGAESRGGILLDHGTHWLYLLLDLAGSPSALQAWHGRLAHHDYDVEDTIQLTLEYPDRLATCFLTWAGARRESRVRFVGPHGLIDWTDSLLRLETDRRTECLDLAPQLTKAAYRGWFAQLFHDFVTTLDTGAPTPFANEVAPVAALLDACYTACESGRRHTLPTYA